MTAARMIVVALFVAHLWAIAPAAFARPTVQSPAMREDQQTIQQTKSEIAEREAQVESLEGEMAALKRQKSDVEAATAKLKSPTYLDDEGQSHEKTSDQRAADAAKAHALELKIAQIDDAIANTKKKLSIAKAQIKVLEKKIAQIQQKARSEDIRTEDHKIGNKKPAPSEM